MRAAKILLLTGLCSLTAISPPARPAPASQGGFKTVDSHGGGRYIYGPLTGRGTMPDAIVYMLRQAHTYFGDRPQVGKFFQSKDGGSVAAFFSVNAGNAGNKPMTGLLIVNRTRDGSASAAVLFDDRSRFGKTEPGMMKSLAAVWPPAGGGDPSAGTPAPLRSAAAALVETTGGDHSAVIGLPAGWTLNQVAGGSLVAVGPNGEMVFLGLLYQGFAMGPDLFTNFVEISNQNRRQKGLPPGAYAVTGRTTLPGRAVQVLFTVDFHDGIGSRRGSVRLDSWGPRAMAVNGSNVPERLADAENATLLAIIRSYKQNAAIVGRLQQGALDRVHADAARANAQSAAINARREASNAAYDRHMQNIDAQGAAFDAHMDGIDRSSKANQDYILDRSVVRDTENGDRGTVINGYADSLVRGNPDRFQVVPNQDLIKGRDF